MAKQPKQQGKWVGGCAEHDMRGPVRDNPKDAANDTHGHGRRMHGRPDHSGGYIERRG